jgi:hypothetical protein
MRVWSKMLKEQKNCSKAWKNFHSISLLWVVSVTGRRRKAHKREVLIKPEIQRAIRLISIFILRAALAFFIRSLA